MRSPEYTDNISNRVISNDTMADWTFLFENLVIFQCARAFSKCYQYPPA